MECLMISYFAQLKQMRLLQSSLVDKFDDQITGLHEHIVACDSVISANSAGEYCV